MSVLELTFAYCYDCTLGSEFVGGNCQRCGALTSRFHPKVREMVRLLQAAGLQTKSLHITAQGRNGDLQGRYRDLQVAVLFEFDKPYPDDVFKGLPEEFMWRCGHFNCTIMHYFSDKAYIDVFMSGDKSELDVLRIQYKILSDVTQHIKRWLKQADEQGYLAVWKLAGYLD